jgi:tRNA(fMet)-specific endonuclease VapC
LILLDTNVIIHFLKGDQAIAAHLKRVPRHELGLPAIVVYELEYGSLRSAMPTQRRRSMQAGFGAIQHVPFDSEAAFAAARIRLELEARGVSIGPLDLLIAGTAVSRGATLATNNIQEFSRIPGLHVVNWRSALN